MSDWLNNKDKDFMNALEALRKLGVREPTPYHLGPDERKEQGFPASKLFDGFTDAPARPDIQSKERYDSIMRRTNAVKAAIEAIQEEMVYRLQPVDKRVD